MLVDVLGAKEETMDIVGLELKLNKGPGLGVGRRHEGRQHLVEGVP